jgi:hypothetical protein
LRWRGANPYGCPTATFTGFYANIDADLYSIASPAHLHTFANLHAVTATCADGHTYTRSGGYADTHSHCYADTHCYAGTLTNPYSDTCPDRYTGTCTDTYT